MIADGAGSAQHLEPRHVRHRVGERARATAGGDVEGAAEVNGEVVGVRVAAGPEREAGELGVGETLRGAKGEVEGEGVSEPLAVEEGEPPAGEAEA